MSGARSTPLTTTIIAAALYQPHTSYVDRCVLRRCYATELIPLPESLPQELVECILAHAYYPHYAVSFSGRYTLLPDYKTLSACCLVSTAWKETAQKMLFHSVDLGHYHPLPLSSSPFENAHYPLFFSPHAKVLASYVRRLDIVLGLGEVGCSPQDFINVVSICKQLYDVTLRVHGIHELERDVLSRLRRAQAASLPHPIRSLSILACGVQSPIAFQLLSVWTNVQFLRLGVELAAKLPAKPTSVRLYELALHRLPPLRVAEWLLASSHDTLRIFDCHTAPSAEYDTLLQKIGRHLISLRIFRHTNRTRALIQHCPTLRELVVIQLSSFLPLGELPPTLEHLSFRSLSSVATIPLRYVITALDKLPRLRLLSCDEPTEESTEFPLLQKKCQEKGVVLTSDMLPVLTVSMILLTCTD